jgi:hypothetical protein
MVSAVVLADFTVDGVTYHKGQQVTISKAEYDQWVVKNWVGPGSDPKTATESWVGPGSEDK